MSPTTAAIYLSSVIKHHLLQGGPSQAKQCVWPSVAARTGYKGTAHLKVVEVPFLLAYYSLTLKKKVEKEHFK